jgi:uncharacterized protein YjbI with pentapeptide repeats
MRLIKLIVISPIKLTNSVLDGELDFSNAIFQNQVNLDNTEFNEEADFVGANFSKNNSFKMARFNRDANFSRSQFVGDANFFRAIFNGDAVFVMAIFKRNAYFDRAKFNDFAYFSGSMFNQTLSLNNTKFSALEIHWDSIKNHIIFDEKTSIALIHGFENLGYLSDAANCYYQYRQEKQARETSMTLKILNIMAWITCGYGVRPLYTIDLSLLLACIFGLIYWIGRAIKNPTKVQDATLGGAIVFSINKIFKITPPIHLEARSPYWQYVVMEEELIGWLLMVLFAATVGHVMSGHFI